MNAMILAAGRGERMKPLTDSTPKALLQVGGTSLLERHLAALRAAGIDVVVINLGWLGEQIVSRIGSGADYGLSVVYSPEGDDVLETGGGIERALPMLGDAPFLVVNGDVYTEMPMPTALADDATGHLVLVPRPGYKPRGDFDLADGRIVVADEPRYTFSGVAVYRPEFFAGSSPGRFPLAPMLRDGARRGILSGEVYAGAWEDVGTPERLAALNERLH